MLISVPLPRVDQRVMPLPAKPTVHSIGQAQREKRAGGKFVGHAYGGHLMAMPAEELLLNEQVCNSVTKLIRSLEQF